MRIIVIFFVAWISFSATVSGQSINKSNFDELVKNLNTRYDEQNPIVSHDGKKLFFTRANDSLNIGGPKDKGDIWVSDLGADGMWGNPENLGRPVNNDLRNYILGFSSDGKVMFLNQERRLPGGLIINDGISFSVLNGSSWSKPSLVSVDYLLNKSKHQSGSISADGSLMLLSLQSYASRGEEDIYISSYKNGKWTQPVNLGSVINTSKQEMTPFLSADKKKLYFSSNGHGGKGGRDIFISERQGDGWTSWSKPKNLGSEVNSIGVELTYFIDSKNSVAYFSTTQNSDGYGDIKAHDVTIEIEEEIAAPEVFEELMVKAEEERKTLGLNGKVTNQKSGESMVAAINVKAIDFEINENTDEVTGIFNIELPLNLTLIEVNVKAPGFMGIVEEMQLEGNDLTKNFELVPLEIGATITLNKLYFERGNAELLEDSFAELDRVVDMLVENPDVKIELSGHTDNQGSSKLNIQLSQERVEKVERYLTEHGIDGKRIKGKGYGGSKPIASNASEKTRKLNRRVEIKILKN